jgi:hypothetical protein
MRNSYVRHLFLSHPFDSIILCLNSVGSFSPICFWLMSSLLVLMGGILAPKRPNRFPQPLTDPYQCNCKSLLPSKPNPSFVNPCPPSLFHFSTAFVYKFCILRSRGKRMPGAIQDAARRGGIPDRDLALMESWYMNSLHPLDDPELQAQWHKRFKRIKEERFMEKMLAGPWREASRPHRWFPKSQWDDPYVDHEYVSAFWGSLLCYYRRRLFFRVVVRYGQKKNTFGTATETHGICTPDGRSVCRPRVLVGAHDAWKDGH